MTESYVWTRRDNESGPAYEAFREYLGQGHGRSLARTSETLNKSIQLLSGWSAKHGWVERVTAYERHIVAAETDGLTHQIAESRDKNLALMDKLRGLLDMRLDDFISRRDDPTIRWTQACVAMTKIEANMLVRNDDQKSTEKIERITEMVERALELQNREPETA